MTIRKILAPYDVSEAEFTAALAEGLHAVPQPAAADLTLEEEEVLSRHGGVGLAHTAVACQRGREIVLVTQANLAAQIRTSMSVDEAAKLLDIDASRVRHRVRDHALYGYKLGAAVRLPRWQFLEGGVPLPRLRAVLQALPEGLHPLEVAGFMTTPDPDLIIGDREDSPQQWLEAGGDVAVVVGLAAAVDTW